MYPLDCNGRGDLRRKNRGLVNGGEGKLKEKITVASEGERERGRKRGFFLGDRFFLMKHLAAQFIEASRVIK